MSVTVCINDGDTHNGPTEQIEAKFPLLIERYALRTDSGGAGRMRGGLGAEAIIQALSPIAVNTTIDRAHCKPWGLDGGLDAQGNAVSVRVAGVWNHDLPNAKLTGYRVRAGDAYMIRTGGGGGFGDPREREFARIAFDVREGYVSAEAAERDYHVVIDRSSGEIDVGKTEAKRRAG